MGARRKHTDRSLWESPMDLNFAFHSSMDAPAPWLATVGRVEESRRCEKVSYEANVCCRRKLF